MFAPKHSHASEPSGAGFLQKICLFVLLALFAGSYHSLMADTYYQAGKRAYSARDFGKAIPLFQKAYRANPKNGNALYYIGRIYDDQRKISRAISYYKQAVHLHMESQLREQALWKILLFSKHKKNWEDLLEYSRLFLRYQSNRRVERLKALAEERYDPESARIKRELERADALERQKKYPQAIQIYEGVLARQPEFHQARWALARLLMKTKDYKRALFHFRYLSQNDEDAWEYHYKSAVCLYRLNRLEDAQASLQKALEKNPQKSDPDFSYHFHYLMGRIAFAKSDFGKACTSLGKAYRLSPKRPSPKLLSIFAVSAVECKKPRLAQKLLQKIPAKFRVFSLARLAEARLAIASGRSKTAWSLAKKILSENINKKSEEMHPAYTPLFFYLGKVAAKKFHYYTAIQAFEKVRPSFLARLAREARKEKPPRDLFWEFNYYYGISLMHTKQYSRSLHVLQKLKKNAKSYYLLARVHALKKDPKKARQMLIQSTKENPKFWEKAEKDPPFLALMQEDRQFREFIKSRNQAREKKQAKENKQPPTTKQGQKRTPPTTPKRESLSNKQGG